MGIKKIVLSPGTNLTLIEEKKFNTITILLVIKNKFKVEEYSTLPLLTSLLTNVTHKYPTTPAFNERKDELYDLHLGGYASLAGESHNLIFYSNSIDENLIKQPGYFDDTIQLLHDVIYDPFVMNGAFENQYFQLQKNIYIQQIKSLDNEKESYAESHIQDLIQIDHPLKYVNPVDLKAIENMTAQDAYNLYLGVIDHEIDIYICGRNLGSSIVKLVQDKFSSKPRLEVQANLIVPYEQEKELHRTVHRNFTQSQLIMRFILPIVSNDSRIYSAIVFNALFGGTPLSKLFKIVREQHNLCYSILSNYAHMYGIIDVHVGFDAKNLVLLTDLIQEQIAALKQGDFNELDLQQTKNLLLNKYRQRYDSGVGTISAIYSSIQLQSEVFNLGNLEHGIQSVTRQDVQNIAQLMDKKITFYVKQKESKVYE